jgi:chorismate mutase
MGEIFMKRLGDGRFYLVREDVLTESMLKTIEVKHLLSTGEATTIQEAVKKVGLSRSAFYKYRDTVFPFESIARERILTIFIQLEDRKGSLATLLGIVSKAKCNVLTIHQTIPVQARANITLSLDVTQMEVKMDTFIQQLKSPDFVESVSVISSGAL